MKRRRFQISRWHRWSIYLLFFLLLVTGLAWAWVHGLDETGDGSVRWREWGPGMMKIHGFAAMGFVLMLGTLLPVHVRPSWRARRNRSNGVFFLSTVGVLTLSGYLLYYLGNEKLRALCSNVHLWIGAVIPLLLVWHIWSGRQAVAKAQ